MAWWQKKLLHYALSRTGLLDDKAIDPKNLDITLGRKNVVELKDVGLNIKRISKLVQLPPSLRVETARVLSLRLTVPADIYQSSIVAEVDGVEFTVRLQEAVEQGGGGIGESRVKSAVNVKSPQHRKAHRRIHSPPPYDPGGLLESDEDVRIPTTHDLAKSFLLDEPAQDRRELEASVAANNKGMEESIASASSGSDDVGVGAAVGLPGFLASFLQGIVDRLMVEIKNMEVKVETEVSGGGEEMIPVTLRLRVGAAELAQLGASASSADRRHVKFRDIAIDLLSDATVFSEPSEAPSRASPTESRRPCRSPPSSDAASDVTRPTTSTAQLSTHSIESRHASIQPPLPTRSIHDSLGSVDVDSFADAHDDGGLHSAQPETSNLDIRPGDDNFSWGSRRSKASAPAEDLWNSMASEDDLPDSLLLERAATPRPHSSRGNSPAATRTRRAVSPYDRGFHSPGSWPRIEDSLEVTGTQQSPGSWPTIDHSQHSMFQPLTPGPAFEQDDFMDNKRAALVAPDSEPQVAEELATPPEPSEHQLENMAQSRFYSHEEAESLYMSAMTQSAKMHVPGGWGSEASPSERAISPLYDRRMELHDPAPSAEIDHGTADATSGNATPRASTPISDRVAPTKVHLVARRMLSVDEASLTLPASKDEDTSDTARPNEGRGQPMVATTAPRGMPGTFSAYGDLAASHRRGDSSSVQEARSMLWPRQGPDAEPQQISGIDINLGVVTGGIDLANCRLLNALASAAGQTFETVGKRDSKAESQTPGSDASLPITLGIRTIHLSLLKDLPSERSRRPDTELFSVMCEQIVLNRTPGVADVSIGRLRAQLSGRELLGFDRSAKLSSSVMLTESTPDIAFSITTNKMTVRKRPVTEVSIETLPVKVELVIGAIDDTLDALGSLSSILDLDLSNSIVSEGGLAASPTFASKSSKAVRFQGDPVSDSPVPGLKVNGRFGGADVTLHGKECAVQLRTTTLKAVHREQATVATVEHVVLTGPYNAIATGAPLSIDLATVRLEYLPSPQDKDLERLLSLLIPSKDKYDNDDDILIDTLLRQRRKGALARVALDKIKVKAVDFDCIQTLTALSGELNRLSAVTKYLPEDERPGLLTLVRVKSIEAQLPVNDRFGKLQIVSQDFHCAHVGLPALLALSVGCIRATRMGYAELVHPLIPLMGAENLPMLMARMLGDEAEPTAKVKLYNVCVEYSVPTILALTGMDVGAAPEEVAAKLAQSTVDFALQGEHNRRSQSSQLSDTSRASVKRTNIELLVHDSALGLTPEKLPAKALFVLTDGRFSTLVPPDSALRASLELHKAAIFITDAVSNADASIAASARVMPNNSTTNVRLAATLSKRGYASVGSIMAAKITARMEDAIDGQSKAVAVDVRNELLLLETCADSTQTLLAIFSGLAPPTPPSKRPKYLTEPMTIEDMMASFTGEPEVKAEALPETLFDVEAESFDDPDTLLDASAFERDTDALLLQSEMTTSLYGPVSGIFGGLDQPDDDASAGDFGETVESLLDDDPFEMPIPTTDLGLGDSALMRDLNKQCKLAVDEKPVDLGSYEIEDLGFDALGAGQQALGSRNRRNTPAVHGQKLRSANRQELLPFRLHLRDIHVIWNIHDGYDWQRTRDGITQAVEQVEARAEERKARRRQSLQDHTEEEPVIGDVLFNSIYIGVPANHDAQELRRQINRGIDDLASETESVPLSGMSRPTAYSTSGRPIRQRQRRRLKLERSRVHKVAFELKGISVDMLVFPPDSGDTVSSVDVRVRELEIFDNVPTSTWRKFLTRLDNDPATREMSKPMAHIEVSSVRTLQTFAAAEIILHASILPLRLHVDQDALDFITRFFEFKDESMSDPGTGEQPFVQRIEVDTVDLRLDYKPKRIDYGGIRSGHTSEFMNIVTLDAADIKLKHAIVYGLNGFAPLHKTLNDIWMPDVTRNQLPTVLAGLAPVRSLVNIGSGVRDVVAIPIREYRKDGRLVRSIQKGAVQFGKTTTSELARLGAKLAIGTQTMLQGAEGLLSPSPPGRPGMGRRISSEQGWHDMVPDDEEDEQRAISAYANQPLGVFSGLRTARRLLEHDLLTAKDAFIAVQGEVLESSNPGAMAAAVVKRAPTVILRPVIGASKAVGTALLGVGNQIDRGNIRKVEDKYKKR